MSATSQTTAPATPKTPAALGAVRNYYIHSFICLLIMFGFGQLPPVAPLTVLGMKIVGIFFGLLYGWIFVDIVWPSMAGLLSLMLLGIMKPGPLFNKSFGDPIVMMMFFIFVFCATINHYGLSRFISMWFITRKFVAGKPWVFTFTFLASIMLLGGLTSASPASLIGWSILYGICDVCGYKKGEGYPTMMVFGVIFSAQIGMALIPFKQAALTVFSAYETMSGVSIDYAKYMLITIIACTICSVLFIIIGKYVFKPDVSKLKNLDASTLDTDGVLRLTKVQKIILGFLFALVALLLMPNFLPADSTITWFLKTIGNTGICMLLVAIMCFLKVDGKPLMQFKAMVDSGVAWGIILLLAVVQPLSSAMAIEESGITRFLMAALDPLFGGRSPMVFVIFMGIVATILTNFMNNGAVGVAMMPIVYSYCKAMNTPPELAVILVVLCIHLALLTPAASASAALLHGNEWSDTRSVWKTAPLIILMSLIAMTFVTITIGSALF